MLPLATKIHFETAPGERRAGMRHALALRVSGTIDAVVENISQNGLRLNSTAIFAVGDTLAIDLPVAGLVKARVAWIEGARAGARFLAPLSRAELSAARLRSPPRDERADPPLIFIGTTPAGQPRYDVAIGLIAACALVAAMFLAALMTRQAGFA